MSESDVSSVTNSERTAESADGCMRSDISLCEGESSVCSSSENDERGWILKSTPTKAKRAQEKRAGEEKEDAWVIETERPAVRTTEWWPPSDKKMRQGWGTSPSPSPTTPRRTMGAMSPSYLASTSAARTRKDNIAAHTTKRTTSQSSNLGPKSFRFGGWHPSTSPVTPRRGPMPVHGLETPAVTPTTARSGSLTARRGRPGAGGGPAQRTTTPPTRRPPPPPSTVRVPSAAARQIRTTTPTKHATTPVTPRLETGKESGPKLSTAVTNSRYPLTSQSSASTPKVTPKRAGVEKMPTTTPTKRMSSRVGSRVRAGNVGTGGATRNVGQARKEEEAAENEDEKELEPARNDYDWARDTKKVVTTPRTATRSPAVKRQYVADKGEKKTPTSSVTPLRDIKLPNRRMKRVDYLRDSIDTLESEMKEQQVVIDESKQEIQNPSQLKSRDEVERAVEKRAADSFPEFVLEDVLSELTEEDFTETVAQAPEKTTRSSLGSQSYSSRTQQSSRSRSREQEPGVAVPYWFTSDEVDGRLTVVREEERNRSSCFSKFAEERKDLEDSILRTPDDSNISTDAEAALSLVSTAKRSYLLDAATYMQLVESLERLSCSREEISARYNVSKVFFQKGAKLANASYATGPEVAKRRKEIQRQHDRELQALRTSHDEYVFSEQTLLDSLDADSDDAERCRERLRRTAGLHYSKLASLRTEHTSKQNAMWKGLPSVFNLSKESTNEALYTSSVEELDRATMAVEMLLDSHTSVDNTLQSSLRTSSSLSIPDHRHPSLPQVVEDPSMESSPPQHSPHPHDTSYPVSPEHTIFSDRDRSYEKGVELAFPEIKSQSQSQSQSRSQSQTREMSPDWEQRVDRFVDHENDERRFLGEEEANTIARILNEMHSALLKLILSKTAPVTPSHEAVTPGATLSSNSISSDSDEDYQSPGYAWTNLAMQKAMPSVDASTPVTDRPSPETSPKAGSTHHPFPSNVMPTLTTHSYERERSNSEDKGSLSRVSPLSETPIMKDLHPSPFSVSPEMSPEGYFMDRRSVSSGPTRQPPPPPRLSKAEVKPRRTRSPSVTSLDGKEVKHGAKDLRGKTPPKVRPTDDFLRRLSLEEASPVQTSPAHLSLSPSLCRRDEEQWEGRRSPSREPTPPAQFAEYMIGGATSIPVVSQTPVMEDELEATVPAERPTPTPKWKQLIDELHDASCGPAREIFDELQEEQSKLRKAHRNALIGKLKQELEDAVEKDKEPLTAAPAPALLNTYRHRAYRRPRNMGSSTVASVGAASSSSSVPSVPVWRTGEGFRGSGDMGYATRSVSPPIQPKAFTRSSPG